MLSQASRCTHIIYAFATMTALGELSFTNQGGVDAAKRLRDVIRIAGSVPNPPKVMFAVGGW